MDLSIEVTNGDNPKLAPAAETLSFTKCDVRPWRMDLSTAIWPKMELMAPVTQHSEEEEELVPAGGAADMIAFPRNRNPKFNTVYNRLLCHWTDLFLRDIQYYIVGTKAEISIMQIIRFVIGWWNSILGAVECLLTWPSHMKYPLE